MPLTDRFRIRVPATSANLGPGYDSLGLAVNLHLTVDVSLSDDDHFLYEGQGQMPDTGHNLIHQGFRSVYRQLGMEPPAVTFRVQNPIPLARGLGSSSAALVAGAVAADTLTGVQLGRNGVFQLCARAEGHPDNVAPAVYGGFTVSALASGEFLTRSMPLPEGWRFLFAVPEFEVPTITARKLVPEQFAREDVIHTASRTALWALAVASADHELLGVATDDVMHQPYRLALLPGFAEALQAARDAGAWAVFLSGAGPTLGVIASPEAAGAVAAAAGTYGRVLELAGSAGYEVSALP